MADDMNIFWLLFGAILVFCKWYTDRCSKLP